MTYKFIRAGDWMYREINEQIYNLKEKIRIKEKLESLKNKATIELENKVHSRNELIKVLVKEEKDVIKLESAGISSLFLSLIGRKEEIGRASCRERV